MKTVKLLAAGSTIALAFFARAVASDTTISATVNGATLSISASNDRFAGAIDSLTFRNKQYINITDHGRELQSAIQFNNFGECLNPNEAGSLNDGGGSTSQTVLQSISGAGNVLKTQANPAYWLAPGANYGKACGLTKATTAQNTTVSSNTIFTKTVAFGYAGIANLIQYDVNWNVPATYSSSSVEADTAYLPSEFSVFLGYDAPTKSLNPLSGANPGSTTNLPVIVATTDGANAMGAISARPNQSGANQQYYAYFTSGSVSKWSCVFGINQTIPAGTNLSFSCPVVVGTVDEVIAAMNRYPSSSSGEIPVFRFFRSPHHFPTTSYKEGASAGFTLEGTSFRVYPNNGGGAYVPLYRCLRPSGPDHFASTQSNCEGTNVEGTYGYISPAAGSGLTALYRFYNSGTGDHLVTTNYNEGSGITYEQTLGYVPIS